MIKNLTPHPINLYGNEDHPTQIIPPEPLPARLATIDLGTNAIAGGGTVELVEFGHLRGGRPWQPAGRHVRGGAGMAPGHCTAGPQAGAPRRATVPVTSSVRPFLTEGNRA